MNWPIHATTNTTVAVQSNPRIPKFSAIHQFSHANSTNAIAMPTHSLGDMRQYQASAATIAKPAKAPGRNHVAGTGMVHRKAVTDHTIAGTQSRCTSWLVS